MLCRGIYLLEVAILQIKICIFGACEQHQFSIHKQGPGSQIHKRIPETRCRNIYPQNSIMPCLDTAAPSPSPKNRGDHIKEKTSLKIFDNPINRDFLLDREQIIGLCRWHETFRELPGRLQKGFQNSKSQKRIIQQVQILGSKKSERGWRWNIIENSRVQWLNLFINPFDTKVFELLIDGSQGRLSSVRIHKVDSNTSKLFYWYCCQHRSHLRASRERV